MSAGPGRRRNLSRTKNTTRQSLPPHVSVSWTENYSITPITGNLKRLPIKNARKSGTIMISVPTEVWIRTPAR